MHIADGVLPAWVSAGGWGLTLVGLGVSLKRLSLEDIPRISIVTAAVFLGSLVHIPLGPTSVHLVLSGITGVLLGEMAFLSFFVALTLQALLFQFGGLFSLGVNSIVMGGPAVLVGILVKRLRLKKALVLGMVSGAAVIVSGLLLAAVLSTSGEGFVEVAKLAFLSHLPVAGVEALITVFLIRTLLVLRPALLLTALCLFVASPALAHRLDMDVFKEGDRLRVEVFFPDGTPGKRDEVKMFCGTRFIATCITDENGVCYLPLPKDCHKVDVVVLGKLGHRVSRSLVLEADENRSQKEAAEPPKRHEASGIPFEKVLSGLSFIFSVAAFLVALDVRRRLKRIAPSGDRQVQ